MKRGYVIILLALIVGCASVEDYKPVFRVGNRTVFLKGFRKNFYIYSLSNNKNEINEKNKKEFLEAEIRRNLKLQAAYDMQLDADPGVLDQVKRKSKDLLLNYVLEDVIAEKIVTDEVYRQYYDRKHREIKARHIYFPKSQNAETNARHLEVLDSLRTAILHGADFEKLARTYSKDSLSAGRGGNLGFMNDQDNRFDKAFYDKLYTLKKGDLSASLELENGLHLIEILEQRSLDALPFDMMRRKYKRELYADYASELNKFYGEWYNNLADQHPLEMQSDNINAFLEKANAVKDSLDAVGEYPEAVAQFFKTDMVLMTLGSRKYTVAEFLDDVNLNFRNLKPEMLQAEQLEAQLKRMVRGVLIRDYGKRHQLYHHKVFREQLLELKHKFMVERYEQIVIKDVTNQDKVENYYREHWQAFNKREIPFSDLTGRQQLQVRKTLWDMKEKEQLQQLREKYPVVIYEENLKAI